MVGSIGFGGLVIAHAAGSSSDHLTDGEQRSQPPAPIS